MKKVNDKKGFTLVEMILVIAIFSVIIASITGFFVMIIRGKAKSITRVEAQEQARIAINRIAYEVKRSTGVNVISKLDVEIATSASSTFVINSSDVPRNPTTFNVSNGILYMKYGSSTPVALTSRDVSVSSLIFSKYSGAYANRSNGVVINMTVYKLDGNGQTEFDVYYPIETAIEILGH